VQRIAFTPRPNWQQRCEELGFTFHSIDGVYWDESVAYELTLAQVETLEQASEELHQRYLAAVAWVIEHQHFEPFDLPTHAIALIVESWQRQEPALYGRFAHPSCWSTTPTPPPACWRPAWCSGIGCATCCQRPISSTRSMKS
jgi:glutathionylspermidine synthase